MREMALIVAGIVFLIVGILHLARVIFKVEIKIGKFVVPLWPSIFGFIVALLLSLWMFRAGR
jgi:hypothetical protein